MELEIEVLCDFCLTISRADEVSKVREAIIDKSPGYQAFTSLLKELFGCVIEATNICKMCMEKVIAQYTFREKIFKNLRISAESLTQTKVKNYLNKCNEPTSVVIHSDILSIVPDSKKELFECEIELQDCFSPRVSLEIQDIDDLKHKLKEEVNQQKPPVASSEGIFGDDFYASLPSTSTVQKRKSRSISSEGSRKKAKVVKEEINIQEISTFEELLQPLPIKSEEFLHVDSSRLTDSKNILMIVTKQEPSSVPNDNLIKTRKPKSRKNSFPFKCQKCGKVLLSPQALRYHVENLHILKEISNETIWVSNKMKEGRRGSEWHCCECAKIYSSPQALRAHLKSHYTKIFKDER